jgi:hypothetical protein
MPVSNEAAGRPSPAWLGPDNTINAGRTMSGAEFNALRDKAAAERAGVKIFNDGAYRQRSPYEQLGTELGPGCGLPLPAARLLAREISSLIDRCNKLERHIEVLQAQRVRQNPPHLSKIEKRDSIRCGDS